LIGQFIYTAAFAVLLTLLTIDANTHWVQFAGAIGAFWFWFTLVRLVVYYYQDNDPQDG
jgi:hypothetical protein